MHRPIALDFSRSSSSVMLIAAFPKIQERFSLTAFISNFCNLSLLRCFRRLLSGFSFAHCISFTCSAEMSVLLITGCAHPHMGFHRGLRLGTSGAYHVLSFWSVLQLRCVIASASGATFSMTDAVCCVCSSCSPLLLQHHHPDTIVLECFKRLGLLFSCMIALIVLH